MKISPNETKRLTSIVPAGSDATLWLEHPAANLTIRPVTGPLLSAIMIVKDEEADLRHCLASLRGVADEVVVVDTGSSDRTVEIARDAGAVLASFPWNGSEADARNFSVRTATGRWLLMIDADEVVSAELAAELRPMLERLDRDPATNSLSVLFRNHYPHGETGVTRLLRIGRHVPGYAFAGAIHPSCNYVGRTHALAGHLDHYGYQWTDEMRRRKSAHVITHLLPRCTGPRPPLKPLCELLTALLLAGDQEEFARRWQQALAWSRDARTRGPESMYWLENMANILPAFAAQNDFVTGRAEAEAILDAHPGHAAANFYLLQAAVLERAWETVERHAAVLTASDLQVPGLHQIIYPERQLIPARGWLWLAHIQLGKDAGHSLPVDLEHVRVAHIILAAQARNLAPLTSLDPAVAAALRFAWTLQDPLPLAPGKFMPILTKLERTRAQNPVGSLPHLLNALTRAGLHEKVGQFPAMIAGLRALAEDYPNLPWLLSGLKELSTRQHFALNVFQDKFLHQA